MPLSFDPDESVPLYLQADMAKPEAERRALLFKPLTYGQAKRYDECRKQAADLFDRAGAKIEKGEEGSAENIEAVNIVVTFIKDRLQGWRNFAEPFSWEAFTLLFTLEAIGEMFWNAPGRQLDKEDKKKSESPPPSDAESSAENAPAASA